MIAGVAKRIGADKERKARNLDEALGAELTGSALVVGFPNNDSLN